MNAYVENRALLIKRENEIKYKKMRKSFKGLTLASMILILVGVVFYCIGRIVPAIYFAFLLTSITILITAFALYLFGLCFYGPKKQGDLNEYIRNMDEQINLFLYGGEPYTNEETKETMFINSFEELIKRYEK